MSLVSAATSAAARRAKAAKRHKKLYRRWPAGARSLAHGGVASITTITTTPKTTQPRHELLPTIVGAQLLPTDGGLLHVRGWWPGTDGSGEPADPEVRQPLVREALSAAFTDALNTCALARQIHCGPWAAKRD